MQSTKGNEHMLAGQVTCTQSSDESLLYEFFTAYRKKKPIHRNKEENNTLLFIERFVADCIAKPWPGFREVKTRAGRTEFIGTPLSRNYFDHLNRYLGSYSKDCFYSAPVDLFFTASRDLHLLDHQFIGTTVTNAHGITDAELFNRLIDKIREVARTPQYRGRLAKDNHRSYLRFLDLVEYVDALFDHVRSRLIVIRLDLDYRRDPSEAMKVGQAQDDLKHFFNNMRSKPSLFDDHVGSIWKLEDGDSRGEHFHVVLFFTNDRLSNDCHRAEQIGRYWENVITKGRGTYFNCNRPSEKAKQTKLCIGRIEYYDDEMRYNLLYPLAYFCKDEQNIRAKPKQKSRTYGRGKMPPERGRQTGRLRSVSVQPKAYLSHPF